VDADTAAEQFFGQYPTGPLVVHVVDHDHEYWLEVTEVKGGSLIEPPWKGGVILETRPIPDGVLARASITKPRPYFQPLVISPQPIDDDAKKWVESLPDASIPAGTLHRLPDKLTRAGFAPDLVGIPITEQEVTLSRPEPTMQIDVDIHYGRTPTNEDIATKSPEQLRQMYPSAFGSAAEHDPALDSLTSETDNLKPSAPELRFQQYRDPFQNGPLPLPGKSYTRQELAQHGQLPETGWRYETAPEFQGAGTEHLVDHPTDLNADEAALLAREMGRTRDAAQELVRGDGVQSLDQSEPHYMSPEELSEELRRKTEAAKELNRNHVNDAFGIEDYEEQ